MPYAGGCMFFTNRTVVLLIWNFFHIIATECRLLVSNASNGVPVTMSNNPSPVFPFYKVYAINCNNETYCPGIFFIAFVD